MSSTSSQHRTNNNELSFWLKESNDRLVVVVFMTEWAGTVEVLRDFLDKICLEMPGHSLIWVDADANEELTLEMGVHQIPTVILLRNQEIVDHISGLIPRRRLAAKMASFL